MTKKFYFMHGRKTPFSIVGFLFLSLRAFNRPRNADAACQNLMQAFFHSFFYARARPAIATHVV
jgi:hypothetical protein